MPRTHCGRCHTCGDRLRTVLDGEEWCDTCHAYRRYWSHGWARSRFHDPDATCPERIDPCNSTNNIDQRPGAR
jgi:hypothetical protein